MRSDEGGVAALYKNCQGSLASRTQPLIMSSIIAITIIFITIIRTS